MFDVEREEPQGVRIIRDSSFVGSRVFLPLPLRWAKLQAIFIGSSVDTAEHTIMVCGVIGIGAVGLDTLALHCLMGGLLEPCGTSHRG